ncbi:DNA primase/helicase [Shigella phage ESh36]|nr:DNA primase/helicase [Shigella phage ESh36]
MLANVYNLDGTAEYTDFDEYLASLRCWSIANHYASINGNDSSAEEIFEALMQTEKYNAKLYEKTDKLLDYNDEVLKIEELEEDMMYDISVAGDQLFYANGILTKNSAGLPATADFMLAVIETEELAAAEQQLIKQIKSRYGDKNKWNKFLMGVQKGNQKWVEIEQDSTPTEVSEVAGSQQIQAEQNRYQRNESTRAQLDALANELKF